MKTADLVGGALGILIGLFVFWQSAIMPTDVVMKIGPGFFPRMLACGLIFFSGVLLVNALRGRSKGTLEPQKLSDKGVQRGLIMLVAAVVFGVVMEPLGFVLTSVIFLTLMLVVLGTRKPAIILCIPALITASIWVVFEKALHLSLPVGVLSSIL